jgi:hypothetical protein
VHQKMHSNGTTRQEKIERLELSSSYSRFEAKAQDARGLVGPGSLGPLIQRINLLGREEFDPTTSNQSAMVQDGVVDWNN